METGKIKVWLREIEREKKRVTKKERQRDKYIKKMADDQTIKTE